MKSDAPGRLNAGHRDVPQVEALPILHLTRRALHMVVDAACRQAALSPSTDHGRRTCGGHARGCMLHMRLLKTILSIVYMRLDEQVTAGMKHYSSNLQVHSLRYCVH